jgi:hypothetical protein
MRGLRKQLNASIGDPITDEQLYKIRDSGMKIIICTGDVDRIIPSFNSEYLATILEAPLRVVKSCAAMILIHKNLINIATYFLLT